VADGAGVCVAAGAGVATRPAAEVDSSAEVAASAVAPGVGDDGALSPEQARLRAQRAAQRQSRSERGASGSGRCKGVGVADLSTCSYAPFGP